METINSKHIYRLEIEMTGEPHDITVSRRFLYDGKVEYSDRLTFEEYDRSLKNPDIFRAVELFSMGCIPLDANVSGKTFGWVLPGRKGLLARLLKGCVSRLPKWLRRSRLLRRPHPRDIRIPQDL